MRGLRGSDGVWRNKWNNEQLEQKASFHTLATRKHDTPKSSELAHSADMHRNQELTRQPMSKPGAGGAGRRV